METAQNYTPVSFITVYPIAWLKTWEAIKFDIELTAFPENVQPMLLDMVEAGLLKNDIGVISRLHPAKSSDFWNQLKLIGA